MRAGGWRADRLLLLVALALSAACDDDAAGRGAPDVAPTDAGPDAAHPDGALADAAPPDAANLDAALGDAAALDARPPDAALDDAAPDDAAPPLDAARPLDAWPEGVRVNHVQMRGTHNSYHLRPPNTVPDWDYAHEPLDVQLGAQGVRQFELDLHWDRRLEAFRVFHVPGVDAESTCDRFTDCLAVLRGWSDAHPGHHLLWVMLEPKDDVDVDKVWQHFDALDAEILDVWGRDRVFAPDDLRGGYATLREAVLARGWPTVEATRGKILFSLLDSERNREEYLARWPMQRGRMLFAHGAVDAPYAAVVQMDDAVGREAEIRAAARQGFLIRTRGNLEPAWQVALGSGAHAISTDFPLERVLPDGAPSRCNPVTAGPDCDPATLEDP
ncbi:MAG: hypothetical protein H6704_15275 [Myxococcales bacterium]|nr:hypothetical protein [Myxococcales bacterium]